MTSHNYRVIQCQMRKSCDSRLPILLQLLTYVGLDMKVTCTIYWVYNLNGLLNTHHWIINFFIKIATLHTYILATIQWTEEFWASNWRPWSVELIYDDYFGVCKFLSTTKHLLQYIGVFHVEIQYIFFYTSEGTSIFKKKSLCIDCPWEPHAV